MKSILDFRPVDEAVVATSGAEPSLRELVYKYYSRHFDDEDKVVALSREYCRQVELKLYGKVLVENGE